MTHFGKLLTLFALLTLAACKGAAPVTKVATCMTLMGPFQITSDKDTQIDVSKNGIVEIHKGSETLILSLANCSVDEQRGE